MARAVLLIDHMIRKASLIAARIIRDAMNESQATSRRKGGMCVMCVIGVTLPTIGPFARLEMLTAEQP
jgi:hypothetical protein